MRWQNNNLRPKIFCLIIAVILWLFIMNDQNPLVEGNYTIPVEVHNLDGSLVALNVPESINVRLRMSRNAMLGLRTEQLEAHVNLEEIQPGNYRNMPIKVKLPADAEFLQQVPLTFDLVVERFVVKTIPLTAKLVDTPEKGFLAEIKEIMPNQVTVSGSESLVDQVAAATIQVSVADHKDAFEVLAPVRALDIDGSPVQGIIMGPEHVKAAVIFKNEQGLKTMKIVAPLLGEPAKGYVVKNTLIDPAQVMVNGNILELENIKEWRLENIDISGATENIEKSIELVPPEDGYIIPAQVRILVTIDKKN